MEPLKWYRRQERKVELPGVESFALPCQCYFSYCMRFLLETCMCIYVHFVVCASREHHDIKPLNEKAYYKRTKAI